MHSLVNRMFYELEIIKAKSIKDKDRQDWMLIFQSKKYGKCNGTRTSGWLLNIPSPWLVLGQIYKEIGLLAYVINQRWS